jgi:hypothetical protein
MDWVVTVIDRSEQRSQVDHRSAADAFDAVSAGADICIYGRPRTHCLESIPVVKDR